MPNHITLACEPQMSSLRLDHILPLKKLAQGTKKTSKYECIAASIREVGVIEPLIVFPIERDPGRFMLLDGHIRFDILNDMGIEVHDCLVAKDDEGFTYNHKVNRLSPVQEHFMILKAIKNGVPEERIAKSLHIDVRSIRRKRDLLHSICPEAVEILREKRFRAGALSQFKKVRPMRQIEMAELMIASHNFSVAYAECLFAATPADQLIEPEKAKDVKGLSSDEIARMEREMESLGQEFKKIDDSYGRDMLNLIVAARYLKKLLDNAHVTRYLSKHHAEILVEFQTIAETKNLAETK